MKKIICEICKKEIKPKSKYWIFYRWWKWTLKPFIVHADCYSKKYAHGWFPGGVWITTISYKSMILQFILVTAFILFLVYLTGNAWWYFLLLGLIPIGLSLYCVLIIRKTMNELKKSI